MAKGDFWLNRQLGPLLKAGQGGHTSPEDGRG